MIFLLEIHILLIEDLDLVPDQQFFLYSIVEKGTDVSEVKKRLKNISLKIDFDKQILESPVVTKELRDIKKIIDKELNDLCMKPGDRARNIWG